MPWSNQFAIALELTNVLLIAPAISSATAAAVRLARDLRKSGSDLLVEEDLAEVFGRNRIDDKLESSFRTAVKNSTHSRASSTLYSKEVRDLLSFEASRLRIAIASLPSFSCLFF
jgi:hypothetical protein